MKKFKPVFVWRDLCIICLCKWLCVSRVSGHIRGVDSFIKLPNGISGLCPSTFFAPDIYLSFPHSQYSQIIPPKKTDWVIARLKSTQCLRRKRELNVSCVFASLSYPPNVHWTYCGLWFGFCQYGLGFGHLSPSHIHFRVVLIHSCLYFCSIFKE